ncbi:hypothetical protein PR048_010100 [Dryococelus australis]|uniref:Uncharacterized protein n=1 Tax=Dryococelus australis TaxID=614101 RepID=A0ABQ9I1T1_9NEOP|nr:hypothetical protein PR048_010100 [Dryococelus australis]
MQVVAPRSLRSKADLRTHNSYSLYRRTLRKPKYWFALEGHKQWGGGFTLHILGTLDIKTPSRPPSQSNPSSNTQGGVVETGGKRYRAPGLKRGRYHPGKAKAMHLRKLLLVLMGFDKANQKPACHMSYSSTEERRYNVTSCPVIPAQQEYNNSLLPQSDDGTVHPVRNTDSHPASHGMDKYAYLPVTLHQHRVTIPQLRPVESMSRQSQCSRVLQAPSSTVGFTRQFHTLSSIQSTNTSIAVVPQSPVDVHTSLRSRTLGQAASVKDCRPQGPSQSHQNILASSLNVSETLAGERRSVKPASLAAVGINGIPRRVTDSHERIVPGIGEGELGLRLRRGAAESAPAAALRLATIGSRGPGGYAVSLLASHQGDPDPILGRESCLTMPLVGGFSRQSPVFPALSFRRCSILASITLIGSQDLDVKSHPNLFTHSLTIGSRVVGALDGPKAGAGGNGLGEEKLGSAVAAAHCQGKRQLT